MKPFVYFNGKIMPLSEAHVGPYDIGLLRGFGIYEALTTYNRKPFMLKEHLERFHRSTKGLSLTIPASDRAIAEALDQLIEKNVPKNREAIVRIILTGGAAIEGIEYDRAKPTFYILVEPLTPLPAKCFSEGVGLIMREHGRQFMSYKTTNYIQAVLLQKERKEAGALEILYSFGGRVLECSTSNFFIVKNGRLITPKDDILLGITRKVTIDLARPSIKIEERPITVKETFGADEAFLTSSFKEIVPVVAIDGKKIGGGKVGPITKKLMGSFHRFAKKH